MQMREPKALIVMVLLLWTHVIFEDVHHLLLDLEYPNEVWDEYNEDKYYLSRIGSIFLVG